MSLHVPESLKGGHEAIHAALKSAMREEGRTGEIGRQLAQVLDGHMMREEKFALRPLGLLKAIARGETPADLGDAAKLVGELGRELPQMIDEHREIARLARDLAREAEAAGKPDYVDFAEDLILHAHLEEDVLYPAALVVGRFAALVRGK